MGETELPPDKCPFCSYVKSLEALACQECMDHCQRKNLVVCVPCKKFPPPQHLKYCPVEQKRQKAEARTAQRKTGQ